MSLFVFSIHKEPVSLHPLCRKASFCLRSTEYQWPLVTCNGSYLLWKQQSLLSRGQILPKRAVSTGKLPSITEEEADRGRSKRGLLAAGSAKDWNPASQKLSRFGREKKVGILESTFSSESNICGMPLMVSCGCEEGYDLFAVQQKVIAQSPFCKKCRNMLAPGMIIFITH